MQTVLSEIAFSADFDAVGGFCDVLPPGPDQLVLRVAQVPSPLGPILLAGDEREIYLVEFGDRRLLDRQLARLRRLTGAAMQPGSTSAIEAMSGELDAYFAGRLRHFTTLLRLAGTAHQIKVWQALREVLYGETWSYGELARHLGLPAAARAVAAAVGQNPFAIVLPCHRIVGADGQLTGYAGGLTRKRLLLDLERSGAKSV